MTMTVRVTFARPGFFIADARVVLLLDGVPFYDGGFLAGIDAVAPAAPGLHRLESIIDIGIVQRRRAWDVAAPCLVALEYSRLWGNFSKKPRIVPL